MTPFAIETDRLVLDQPTEADVDEIALYCADPVFRSFMSTPWPYEREHARTFVRDVVPRGWADTSEWTWAVRDGEGRPLLGVVGIRLSTGRVGCWLGSPHRGLGVIPEALSAAIREVFHRTDRREVLWDCLVRNHASLRVAQKLGFERTGQGIGVIPTRDGASADLWTGRLRAGV